MSRSTRFREQARVHIHVHVLTIITNIATQQIKITYMAKQTLCVVTDMENVTSATSMIL